MIHTVLLCDICDIKIGRTPPRKEEEWFSSKNGNKWVSIKDMGVADKNIYNTSEYLIDEAVKKFRIPLIKSGTLMLSFKLTVGRLCFAAEDMYSNEAIAQLPIVDSSIVDKDWLYYYLKNFNFGSLSSTSSIATAVNSQSIKNIKIDLPDLETQKKIADILSSLDEKIELNRKMNETLEQMGQALFRHYFIDNPEAEKWKKIKLDDLCLKIASGGTPSTKREDYYDGDIAWFSTKELQNSFVFKSEKTITQEGLLKSSAKLFPINTVMMAIYAAPTVGRLGILTKEASFNQAACGLVAKPEIGYEFLYLCLLVSRSELNNMANGAAQQNISVGKVRDFKVFEPDKNTLLEFRRIVEPMFIQLKSNCEQNQILIDLRERLLPRLISGKIKL